MKVIFLDHDGVICLSTEWGGRYKKREKDNISHKQPNLEMPLEYRFDNFNQKAVKVLNEILEETGSEIVVSSDWKRWANVEEMGEYYESKGIIKNQKDDCKLTTIKRFWRIKCFCRQSVCKCIKL